MKVLTGPQAPLQPAKEAAAYSFRAAMTGAAFVLFALGALAMALLLEGPGPGG